MSPPRPVGAADETDAAIAQRVYVLSDWMPGSLMCMYCDGMFNHMHCVRDCGLTVGGCECDNSSDSVCSASHNYKLRQYVSISHGLITPQ